MLTLKKWKSEKTTSDFLSVIQVSVYLNLHVLELSLMKYS